MTHIKHIFLSSVLWIGLATGAQAQFAPGSQQSPEAYNNVGQQEQNVLPPVMGAESGETENNPCPEPKKAMGSTPDDLAKIQEDITRFTLCVQRAQLLERLNELAESNIETIDTALNLTAQNTLDGNAVPGIMPSVPMPQMSDSAAQLLQDEPQSNFAPMPSQPQESSWRIRNIEGKGGAISAQLVHGNGTLLKVKTNQALPEGSGRVISISQTSVRIEQDGQKQTLQWVE